MSKNASTTATTRKVRVTVRPVFLAEKSAPEDGLFVWAYEVQIENLGGETLQLLGRLWRIVDARGDTHEVKGVGVIGEQPLLEPGESFAYTSMVPLASPSGMMMGTYQMLNERGEIFDIEIPAFSLDSPFQPVRLN